MGVIVPIRLGDIALRADRQTFRAVIDEAESLLKSLRKTLSSS